MPRRMAKSPQLTTSGRHREKINSISAVQTPMPGRDDSLSITRASGISLNPAMIQVAGSSRLADSLDVPRLAHRQAALLDVGNIGADDLAGGNVPKIAAQPSPDCSGCLAGNLLCHDAVDKGLKQVGYDLPLDHAYAVDCPAELLVAAFQVIDLCVSVSEELHPIRLSGRIAVILYGKLRGHGPCRDLEQTW